MNLTIKLLCFCLFIGITSASAEVSGTSSTSEMLIVHVLLNGSDAGTHFMQKEADDFIITGKQLQNIGIQTLPNDMPMHQAVSLKSLHRWLGFELDEQTGDLLLTVKATLLPTHEESLLVANKSDATWIQSNALFLNYTLDYTTNPTAANVFRTPFELGLSLGGTSFISQFSDNKKIYRTKTQWSYDHHANLQRWVMGDIQASSGLGSAALAGIHLFKNFGINPQLITTPGLESSILLDNAADIEVLMDGNSVYKGHFPAGVLNLKDIPFYRTGSIQAQLIVRDVFGREKTYQQLLYGSTGMLAKGLSDYDVALGVQSTSTGIAEPTYGKKLLFYGHYRYGVSSGFVPSMGIESDGKNNRISLASSLLLGAYGQLDTTLAFSDRVVQGKGQFVRVNYNYVGTSAFSPSIFFREENMAYGGIGDGNKLPTSTRREFGSSISVNDDSLGGLTGRWTRSEDFSKQRVQTGELLWNAILPKEISLTTQFSRRWAAGIKAADQVSASLGHSFANGLYLSANYSTSNQVNTFSMNLQWSPPLGEGFGVNESLNQQTGGTLTSNNRVEYRNQYGDVAINGSTGKQSGNYHMQLNSAFVWTEGDVYISRPVRDAFALVRVNGGQNGMKDGMKVNLKGQYVGKTNRHGELLVPYAYSYIDNQLGVDFEAVSMDYSVSKTSQNVTMAYRGGGLVEFDVIQQHTIEGRLFYKNGETLQTAQYSTLEYMQDGSKQTTIIGDDGALYLENLQAGDYAMTVFDDVHTCQFNLHIADSEKVNNDIGRVICVLDAAPKEEKK